MKICGFAICGLAHLKIWGFAIADWAQELADLQFSELQKKFACPPLHTWQYNWQKLASLKKVRNKDDLLVRLFDFFRSEWTKAEEEPEGRKEKGEKRIWENCTGTAWGFNYEKITNYHKYQEAFSS
jgi:hypothetical protein